MDGIQLSSSSKPKIVSLNVLKRDSSTQPFDKNKLVTSMTKAGATKQQASLVSDRVVSRLGGFKQPVPASQLSSMVARSLSKVNPAASGQYTKFRDRKLGGTQAPAAKGAALVRRTTIQVTARKAPVSSTSTVAKPTAAVAQVSQPGVLTTATAGVIKLEPSPPTGPLPDLIIERVDGIVARPQGAQFANKNGPFDRTDYVYLRWIHLKNIGEAPAVFEMTNSKATKIPVIGWEVIGTGKSGTVVYLTGYDGVGPFVLQPGEETGNASYVALGCFEPGNYTVKITADPQKSIPESDETNNEYTLSFEVVETPPPPMPDLIISSLGVTTTSDPYSDTTFEVTIKNVGIENCDYTSLKNNCNWQKLILEISGINSYVMDSSKSDIPDFLEPGQSFSLKYRTFIDMTTNTYTWTLKVNPENYIPEDDTDNNEAKYEVTIGENRTVVSVRLTWQTPTAQLKAPAEFNQRTFYAKGLP